MSSKSRRDAVDAQQLFLPRIAGLLLIVAGLSAVGVPWPYGLIICLVAVTVLALLLRQNAQRRREGIDGWPTAFILGPYVAVTLVVLVGHLVSERLAGVLAAVLVVGALGLLVRRLRRSGEPARAAHHFRGATMSGDARQ